MALSFLGKGGRSGASNGGSGGTRFPALAEVRAYWEGLREGGALPERDRIDPRGIAGALENTFLLERVASGIGRFRIAGMHLHDLMGMDVRGMPLSAMFEPAGRIRLADALEGVFATPAVLELWLEAERGIGRPALEGRLIVLPLTGVRGETSLALGCLAMEGSMGRAPRRFAISGLMSEVIERRRTNWRETPPEVVDRRLQDLPPIAAVPPLPATARQPAGLAEPPADFTPRPPRGKPHLRLVHSRD
ncbi:PAS domain-containing protein [bacterium]|nr:PAS domain-containing protein [bacterium]